MTLKDKLPDRLKCSPLLTMESDSDIETIAESIVNLSDSDGDFFKKTEKLLLMACLGYLRDWCEPSQRTIGNLISLLDAALPKDNETHTTLDNLFYGARLRRYRRTLQGRETDGDNDELRLSRENPERHGR